MYVLVFQNGEPSYLDTPCFQSWFSTTPDPEKIASILNCSVENVGIAKYENDGIYYYAFYENKLALNILDDIHNESFNPFDSQIVVVCQAHYFQDLLVFKDIDLKLIEDTKFIPKLFFS